MVESINNILFSNDGREINKILVAMMVDNLIQKLIILHSINDMVYRYGEDVQSERDDFEGNSEYCLRCLRQETT